MRKNNWLLAPDHKLIIRLLPLDEAAILLLTQNVFCFFSTHYSVALPSALPVLTASHPGANV